MNLNLTLSRFNITGISFDFEGGTDMNGSEKFNKPFVKTFGHGNSSCRVTSYSINQNLILI